MHLNALIISKRNITTFPQKPWWNDELRRSRNILQQMFSIWQGNNFPRLESDTSYNRYRYARKTFRSLVKHAKNQATVDHYINIEKLKKIKPKTYWKEMKILNNKPKKLYTINGKTTHSDISNEFGEHFNNLLNTPRVKDIDNTTTNAKLDTLLGTLQNKSAMKEKLFITETEVINTIKKLKYDKVCDPFQLKAEHYIHALGDTFNTYLTDLINEIFKSTTLPPSLSTSIIIPLIKSHNKPLNSGNNYHGISLLPIITKILELIILERCPVMTKHINSQFGFTAASSTLHAEVIRDTLRYYNNNDTHIYMCKLDAEKTFDCCNWFTLFSKLAEKDIPTSIITFLIKLYRNGSAHVNYISSRSGIFSLNQGVQQGGVLSPYLYNLYTEDLITNIGTFLSNKTHTAIIVYADDIILLSPNLKHLQSMVA